MSSDSAPRYRRRTRWPVLVLLALLLAGGVVVWSQAFKPAAAQTAGCNHPSALLETSSAAGQTTTTAPPSGNAQSAASSTAADDSTSASASSETPVISTTLGTFTDPDELVNIRPADPTDVPVRVLNASAVTGQAKTVTDELRVAGFTRVGQQDNDPLYPNFDLHCYGEIRYGYAGLAEARTVLIVAPCAQLILDDRADNTVDLSLGHLYDVEPMTDDVKQQLTDISNAWQPPPVIEGQTVSVRPLPSIPPLPDRSGCPDDGNAAS